MALLRNQAEALLRHERIVTTVPKAKELRPFVERLITVAKRGVKAAEPKGRTLAARRLVMRDIVNDDVVDKLFDQLAPRFMERPGGYTRILRLGHRRGDGGEIAQIELRRQRVRSEEGGSREGRAGSAPPRRRSRRASASGSGPRRRACAARRTRKADATRGKASKPARARRRRRTTPRKAGGS